MSLNKFFLTEIIEAAYKEDFGYSGDLTTDNLIARNHLSRAKITAKQAGVVAGLDVAAEVFHKLDSDIKFITLLKDGSKIKKGDVLAELEGSALNILKGERIALNFLQRLSGIASRSRKFVDLIKEYEVDIVDTRKTTPGLRMLEKYAVKVGGAKNHRSGLYDAVMIKDNHIKVVGSIKKAVSQLKNSIPHTVKIEVETEDLAQVEAALEAGVEIVMLDNMELPVLKKAVGLIADKAVIEASGGIDEKNIKEIAAAGVDIISLGTLTHQIRSLDIALDLQI
ncbi:nicotinate-nucleotide pyrophosphorylase [carboxylating] [Halanaerobium congolense]|jgi:nicotinate-nucleotide pyrophosphorylase (carboxylating)|uniref:Probable nicotinate-nucleotide pyrophosphorylase [carboxylating] n=1 Tax=Halanaerobium congolense TaxID=54121 RepID=A0A1G6IYV1_9FIRM|nr:MULTISPECIES: carboxylating nicotinate-nucleotide diphosphorylase [Halanaerobium]KXS47959.1 MAG: nicotinate-nucleotide pyrophosphorylase (carboxylating) [Halanaerobium sp. T82-1]PUU87329.1 MAG: nicotinate-nucleotide pyrophosphorylase (carboxylating) [Halanaerobium sp.]PUU90072.1 MAG: nicotinate-nucleotide pyrophosphorylase (carboxylating) [Halanaerobium sp.]TDP24140.1 nicotinate-nucleotide pyrophosphorylase [carboxylating] [Halanaerobium congolense]SDC11591.1 nicotinate-nucleotide pyrophosp